MNKRKSPYVIFLLMLIAGILPAPELVYETSVTVFDILFRDGPVTIGYLESVSDFYELKGHPFYKRLAYITLMSLVLGTAMSVLYLEGSAGKPYSDELQFWKLTWKLTKLRNSFICFLIAGSAIATLNMDLNICERHSYSTMAKALNCPHRSLVFGPVYSVMISAVCLFGIGAINALVHGLLDWWNEINQAKQNQ